jgi:DNA (cytosine-5)-methyltransferase 1
MGTLKKFTRDGGGTKELESGSQRPLESFLTEEHLRESWESARLYLVLSLFPGVGLLDMAFEDTGFCVVRGPDPLWGGDIKLFQPPGGFFGGVIGGPPCQRFSPLINFTRYKKDELPPNMIPEFERVVLDVAPEWFLMENVAQAPVPKIPGYLVTDCLLDNCWFDGEQHRVRRWSFGTREGGPLEGVVLPVDLPQNAKDLCTSKKARPVCSSGEVERGHMGRVTQEVYERGVRLQGLPDGFDLPGFSLRAKMKAIGNGVPLPMGRGVAKAVKKALDSLQ